MVPDGDKTRVPKPGETPKHPYGQIGLQWLWPLNRSNLWYNKILNYKVRNLIFSIRYGVNNGRYKNRITKSF